MNPHIDSLTCGVKALMAGMAKWKNLECSEKIVNQKQKHIPRKPVEISALVQEMPKEIPPTFHQVKTKRKHGHVWTRKRAFNRHSTAKGKAWISINRPLRWGLRNNRESYGESLNLLRVHTSNPEESIGKLHSSKVSDGTGNMLLDLVERPSLL